MAEIEDPAEIRVDHRLPVRDRHVRGVLEQADARVVHEHVEAAESIDRLPGGRRDFRRIPDIGDDGEGARPELGLRPFELAAMPAGDHDRRAVRHERLRNREPDSLGPTGHQRNRSIERR